MLHPLSRYSHAWDGTTEAIIGAAIEVHRALGPGLLESAYETCLAEEMAVRGIEFDRQVALSVVYRGRVLDCGYRLDFQVGRVGVELKAVENVLPVHRAQLLTYLRLRRLPCGLLLNFFSATLKDGIHRIVNERD
jgi:GxxExxY protein